MSPAVRAIATAAWIRCPAQYISWLEASRLYRGSPLTWMYESRYPSGSCACSSSAIASAANVASVCPAGLPGSRASSQPIASSVLWMSESMKTGP